MCLGQGVQGKGRRGRLAVKGSPQEPLPITPMICHWPVPCHVLGTLVKKAGSVFVQIVVLTVMKDGGGWSLPHSTMLFLLDQSMVRDPGFKCIC